MRAIYSIFFLSLFFVSCTKKTEFETQNYNKSSAKDCKNDYNCANINLTVLEATQKNNVSDSINNAIFNAVRNSVYTGEKPKEVKNYVDLTNSFVSIFTEIKNDLQQDKIPSWEATAKVKVGYQSNRILNVVVDSYLFTGGAHGYSALKSLLFDAKTGKLLPINKVFSDINKIVSIAETKFRIQQKIPENSSFTDAGYFLDKNIFVLSKNVLFTKKGITLHYNQYEVASYVKGPIEIELPYGEIDQYLLVK
ncbi:DUF3298 and DUF4163 domain-containing protein [Flavobacterium psychrotolerans]|uniref:DUF3298/DUF4163 domain-containing protein n=1 Tax=Flavobacterium psychrotolerans TaxID=2169410 RepID=A0A2U1JH17_9FLAO|nr:DUF3298 and DUF4163 domain-containing protein [Flavobacterium psychrotolerans]PWA04304.1 DUF3298/DUF4163 domain-containing protein [Flavobacterium psychrotolerans]